MLSAEKRLNIAILGTRGIPARYGGFETFAEELSKRLVARGHCVTVYCRRFFTDSKKGESTYEGVRQIFIPTLRHKYFETPLHSFFCFLDLFKQNFDVALLCNAANSPFAWLVNLQRIPLAINVDGIERNRTKWNAIGKLWYRIGEIASTWFANIVIADAKVIAEYYLQTYRTQCKIIAYGADAKKIPPQETISELDLIKDQYILYVSRLEPENNALGVIEAYAKSEVNVPLVIVGDAPYATAYKSSLKEYAESICKLNPKQKVIFAGFRFGDAYHELQSNCMIYVQATEVGGTHPALIESMAHGNCVIANGTSENHEVLADAGELYSKNDFVQLAEKIKRLCVDKPQRELLGSKAKDRANRLYSWDAITDQYENLFTELLKK